MPSRVKFSERLDTLREIAEQAGKPVPPVTLYLVRPERDVLDHYASMGVERAVLLLPTRGDAVGAVGKLAARTLGR